MKNILALPLTRLDSKRELPSIIMASTVNFNSTIHQLNTDRDELSKQNQGRINPGVAGVTSNKF
jgi:hypothetical protein